MRLVARLAILVVALGSVALVACTEEAPPPKMPAKVYVPWLVKKKPAPAPEPSTTGTAPTPTPTTADGEPDAAVMTDEAIDPP